MGRVQGKVALVTGGASGIGLSTAALLAKEGAKVVIADFNMEGAREAAENINANGGDAFGIFLDAGDENSIKEAIEFTVKNFGKISVLFNNVGLTNLKKDLDVVNIDLDEWDRLMNVNLKSVLIGSKFAIPHMIEAGGGSIINTASMAGFTGDTIRAAYGASKAAVVNLTKYIATQYGKDKIRCNAVAPGLILTPAAKNNMTPEVLDIFAKYNTLPYHGEPDDIGYTVLFLASDESKFITGQTIQVEGGHYIANPSVPDFNEYMKKAKS
ncbi:SDR family oxidoreductase [Psychrobacillus psychrodurans]|jgi:NAD(P)-dependent dehydrogenase (short-subunit alcohol dehydrogenase family)|uniref:SDR family NAD(P)-dependent oxidoreductase n=1 Tax=Psychrobacillus TaxID=1221880 RepID=UPI0008EADEBC|nr:SDR family NAD(P)-dependent oxidoreductase [Psychrobacillus psychrodurans]MCK1997861.1 SDR family oxidoreductase [Psychrobacillus psychrodurans]MCZ8541044.1 SDR family oxidoreductase [Psychrobacillus psychrodurans]SFM83327.1 NAD(P)-dependent dehydrogenase, short-chain alcohol dehydrogenase family [Psychrobacillus psychrodurans]